MFLIPTIITAIFLLRVQAEDPTHFDIVVALDGTGNFTTIAEAISASPNCSSSAYLIKIKAGVYHEPVFVGAKKTNLTLIGDGMEQTIITWNLSHGQGPTTYQTATVAIHGNAFVAKNITFQNTAADNTQAVALLIQANYTAFHKCKIDGFQDTLYAKNGIQFFSECYVYGTVDFIFGDATVILQNSYIYARTSTSQTTTLTLTAQGRDDKYRTSGTVFHNCTLTSTVPEFNSTVKAVYMGRPWKNFSRTVVMQSFIDGIIDPKGWLQWEGKPEYETTLYYAEYDNRGPGSNTTERVQWPGCRVINRSEAENFTVRNFLNEGTWINSTGIPYILGLI